MLQWACGPPAMSPAQSLHQCASVRRTSLTWATAQTYLRDASRVDISCTGCARAARSRLMCACPPSADVSGAP